MRQKRIVKLYKNWEYKDEVYLHPAPLGLHIKNVNPLDIRFTIQLRLYAFPHGTFSCDNLHGSVG